MASLQRRLHRREPHFTHCRAIHEGNSFPCQILDLSEGGARLLVERAGRVPDRFSIRVQGEILTAEFVRKDRQQVAVTFIDAQTRELRPKAVPIASPFHSVAWLRASLRRRPVREVLKEQALRMGHMLARPLFRTRRSPAMGPSRAALRAAS